MRKSVRACLVETVLVEEGLATRQNLEAEESVE